MPDGTVLPPGAVSPRTWYFCVNARGFAKTLPLMTVAVASARDRTRLRPVCLYNGEDAGHVAAIEALGAEVVRHRSSLEAELRRGYGEGYDLYSGHWLRVDLPLIEREEEFVLYTDVDVMFLRHPVLPAAPATLAAAPEFRMDDLGYFSSGVMVLNLPRLRRLQPAFTAAIRRRLRWRFRYPAHDQESYNRFFGPRPWNRLMGRAYAPMDPGLNWKPFWGLNEAASIVHFHGPKPRHALPLAQGGGEWVAPKFRELWARSPEAYAHYAALWQGYRRPARGARAARARRGTEAA